MAPSLGPSTELTNTERLEDVKVVKVVKKGEKSPISVNVGGNAGDDVMRFLKKHPEVPKGSLILQDVPGVFSMPVPLPSAVC